MDNYLKAIEAQSVEEQSFWQIMLAHPWFRKLWLGRKSFVVQWLKGWETGVEKVSKMSKFATNWLHLTLETHLYPWVNEHKYIFVQYDQVI